MTTATKEALTQVERILHDAGWDEANTTAQPPADLAEISQQLERLSRTPYWPELCSTIRAYFHKVNQT